MLDARIIVAASVLVLSGCFADDPQTRSASADGPEEPFGQLVYAFPLHDENDTIATASRSSPIMLQFDSPVGLADDEMAEHLLLVSEKGRQVPLTDIRKVNDDHGIIAWPQAPLEPGRGYALRVEGTEPLRELRFRVSPATRGPLVNRMESDAFRLVRTMPMGSDRYPITDMVTFRLQFSEPLQTDSVVYGETFRLVDQNEELVPADIFVSGHRLTIDPREDLNPDWNYQLELTEGLQSAVDGATLSLDGDGLREFSPLDSTGPSGTRSLSALEVKRQGGEAELTGATPNSVNLASTLLGPENLTTAAGMVFVELGAIPLFEREGLSVPVRIDAGTLLRGSDVEVKVGGVAPAGFSSETIDVRFLSDASGFLMDNPYTEGETKLIEFYIDLALNTEDAIANAAFAQQLLHVPVTGRLSVEDGRLVIEASGVIEPEVLGVDTATGLISFRLEGFTDTEGSPHPENFVDTQAPFIKSWLPCNENCGEEGDHQDKLRPGDDLTVFVSEPLLPETVNSESVRLEELIDGEPAREMAIRLDLDGSALTVRPDEPLAHGPQYRLTLSADEPLTDLAGHPLPRQEQTFSLAPTLPGTTASQSPLALTTLPGYPCAKTGMDEGPEPAHQGRCAGGKSDDERLPITDHPADRSILVRFSQNMDESSLNRETVFMEVLRDGQWQSFEDWAMETGPRELRIDPLQSWEEGTLYRYGLRSDHNDQGIESRAGNPLQTQLLSQTPRPESDRTAGGPDLVNVFRGGARNSKALTPLRYLPAADANADLVLQSVEAPDYPQIGDGLLGAVRNSGLIDVEDVESEVVKDANVGCRVDESCPRDKFLHLTAMLDVDVHDGPDDSGRIPVDILPSKIYSSGIDVWVEVPIYDFVVGVDRHQKIPTGPLVKRMRHPGEGSAPAEPIPGFIFVDEGQLSFETELDLYLDAPYMEADLPLTNLDHNVRSLELKDVRVRGPIVFLDDGRMQISLLNQAPIDLDVEVDGSLNILGLDLGELSADLKLTLPTDQFILNYLSPNPQQ